MKTFNNISDEAIIAEAMKAVPDYLAGIRDTGDFNVAVCVHRELSALEKLFKKSLNLDQSL